MDVPDKETEWPMVFKLAGGIDKIVIYLLTDQYFGTNVESHLHWTKTKTE